MSKLSIQTQAKPGNTLAEKFSEQEAVELFETLIINAIENDYYSIQEALIENRDLVPYSTFYYLIKKYPVLEGKKKELDAVIMARCNRGAMIKDLSTPMAIWRLKQLGEVDKMEQEITQKNITVEV